MCDAADHIITIFTYIISPEFVYISTKKGVSIVAICIFMRGNRKKLLQIIPSIKVSFMCFRWFLVFNSSMGNIPCFCDFPARSQIYSVKCQISHFWEIELNYLPDVMVSSELPFIDNTNLRLHIIQLLGFIQLQNYFNKVMSKVK